jgi:hypothetical protein
MKVINAVKFNSQIRKVGRVLDKNRRLLKKLRHEVLVSSNAEKSYSWLQKQGFDFNYHTHIESLVDGRLAIMCYEEGYVLETDGVKLFPSSSASLLP